MRITLRVLTCWNRREKAHGSVNFTRGNSAHWTLVFGLDLICALDFNRVHRRKSSFTSATSPSGWTS
jgi:hypothetical protein